jgi:hypothetical protein
VTTTVLGELAFIPVSHLLTSARNIRLIITVLFTNLCKGLIESNQWNFSDSGEKYGSSQHSMRGDSQMCPYRTCERTRRAGMEKLMQGKEMLERKK